MNIKQKIKDTLLNGNIYYDNFLKHNMEFHSMFIEGKIHKESNASENIEVLVDDFIDKIFKNSENAGKLFKLYRTILLNDVDELKEPYGIYWAYSEDKASVYDDENYPHEGDLPTKRFIISSCVSYLDIDWESTFDLYLLNDFYEGEIRVGENAKFQSPKIKEENSEAYKCIAKSKNFNADEFSY